MDCDGVEKVTRVSCHETDKERSSVDRKCERNVGPTWTRALFTFRLCWSQSGFVLLEQTTQKPQESVCCDLDAQRCFLTSTELHNNPCFVPSWSLAVDAVPLLISLRRTMKIRGALVRFGSVKVAPRQGVGALPLGTPNALCPSHVRAASSRIGLFTASRRFVV